MHTTILNSNKTLHLIRAKVGGVEGFQESTTPLKFKFGRPFPSMKYTPLCTQDSAWPPYYFYFCNLYFFSVYEHNAQNMTGYMYFPRHRGLFR